MRARSKRGGSEGVPEGQVFRVHLLFFVRGQRVKKTAMAGWWSLGGAFLLLFGILLAAYLYKINWIKVSLLRYLCPAYLLTYCISLYPWPLKYIFPFLSSNTRTSPNQYLPELCNQINQQLDSKTIASPFRQIGTYLLNFFSLIILYGSPNCLWEAPLLLETIRIQRADKNGMD